MLCAECDEKVVAASKWFHHKFGNPSARFFPYEASIMLHHEFDQSVYTCSTSVASANEPVAHHISAALLHGDTNLGRENIRLPFFDFLGVGAR